MDTYGTDTELREALRALSDRDELERKAAEDLLRLQISNAQRLQQIQIEHINQQAAERLKQEQAINERLVQMGYDARIVSAKNLAQIQAAEEQELLKAKTAAEKAAIIEKYKLERKFYKKFKKEIDEANKKKKEEEAEEDAKKQKKRVEGYASTYDGAGGGFAAIGGLFGLKGQKQKEWEEENGALSDAESKGASLLAIMNHMLDYGKALQAKAKEISVSQAEIDTRLQGSHNRKGGINQSYWRAMSNDIIAHVGMSPFIKQADVVDNLKTLVGKGIAFNVEQRAFIDTISDKIATTFEAADATLVKLVRIQQADTTAARLGMEAALNAFLNNMYETTEYMTEAADNIRANLYEAQALMGATEATAFEWQIQKWMGSLYSVGFQNTSGLSAALGKLAAGDISGINDGGYANLLLMSANKANLSIADILADGLDSSSANKLMQAMVEYLGKIYAETKDSKVIAQQYANVYGLTASDLKAAANLYGSTNNIAKNNLGYNGMIGKLRNMAASMWQRTSSGEMIDNLFDNLNYATASTMGNNPILYTTYMIADMLEGVTSGGIDLPFINTFFGGIDLHTSVSKLMKLATIGGSILGGIGKMVGGMFGGNATGLGMLRGFGVGDNIKTISRGTGTGITAISGDSYSESGYVGNEESADVQSKTTTDATDEGNEQLQAAQESDEVTLTTVDEHVMLIHKILSEVTAGEKSFMIRTDTYSFPH